jgi:hypothetical protein
VCGAHISRVPVQLAAKCDETNMIKKWKIKVRDGRVVVEVVVDSDWPALAHAHFGCHFIFCLL